MSKPLRAGVIGASGIGKHHAKWLNALGCEVSFAGTSAETVAATTQALQNLFGFSGTGYVGVEAMLDAQQPDLVMVTSPPALHYEHFMLAAEQDCHILCEKPVQWDPDKEVAQVLDEAGQMADLARQKGLVAAVNLQYKSAVEPYLDLCARADAQVDPETFTAFHMQMDSRGGKAGAAGEKIWIDLGPHPLSVLMGFAGPGAIVEGSARCNIQEKQVEANFAYQTQGGRRIQARILDCNVPEGPLVRRYGIDDVLVDYEGRNDEDGVYAAFLTLDDAELKATDFMQSSITQFVDAVRGEGVPLATLGDGVANLKMHLQLLMAGRGA